MNPSSRIDNRPAPAQLVEDGYLLLPGVLTPVLTEQAREAAYRVRERIRTEIGAERIGAALARGDNAIRLGFLYEPVFLDLLTVEPMLALIDATLGRAAILRFQNIEIVPPLRVEPRPLTQNGWHLNFPHQQPGSMLTLEVVFSLSGHADGNGLLVLVPGSHRHPDRPDDAQMAATALPLHAPPGSMLVFDGRLWHREGENVSTSDRVMVGMQFVPHFIKPHFDHYRALGTAAIERLPARSRYLLGERTRIPESLDQFYVPESERLYRPPTD